MSFVSTRHPECSRRVLPVAATSLVSVFPHAFDGHSFDRLLKRGVVVAVFALDDWRNWIGDAFDMLDARERERVQRQRQAHHRDHLALAYALHRLVLAHALGMPHERVPLRRDARGRPLVEGVEVDTSLSHAEGYVAVALGLAGPLGVDIEPAHRAGVMPEIAERICHADEVAGMAAHGGAGQGAALLDLWVRKEAFLKAAGVGLEREMESFALPEGRAQALHAGQPVQSVVDLLDLGPSVACAVARVPGVPCVAGWLRP